MLVPTVLVLLSDQPSVTWRITTVRVLRDLLSAIQVRCVYCLLYGISWRDFALMNNRLVTFSLIRPIHI